MPVYEFECPDCDSVLEDIRKMSERENQILCKKCGAAMRHVLSSINVGNKSSSEPHPTSPKPNRKPRTGGIHIYNNHFEGANVGISIPKGLEIDQHGNTFKNVKKPVEIRDK
jgi:putative FmdB family regulatory protein